MSPRSLCYSAVDRPVQQRARRGIDPQEAAYPASLNGGS